jgi:hypothetical protein
MGLLLTGAVLEGFLLGRDVLVECIEQGGEVGRSDGPEPARAVGEGDGDVDLDGVGLLSVGHQ